jgi:predicted dehydrogenase
MSDRRCRFGILGTANIARKNWVAIRNADNCSLAAVASRGRERAEQFIGECQAESPLDPPPRACTYEELIADSGVDALYIPLPTGLRKEWVIRAAEAGKHVLCEKPCAANAADLEEMLAACRRAKVQFMDGVMFMHSRRLASLRQTLDDGESIGRMRRIATQFSFLGSDDFSKSNIRVKSRLEPLGCLGDLGWYTIRFTLWAMNYQMPSRVAGRMLASAPQKEGGEPVPTEFSGELFFDAVSASFYCSFTAEHQQWAVVSGTKGWLHVPDFVLPYFGSESAYTVTNARFEVNNTRFNMEEHARRVAVREYSNNAADAQETHLLRNFAALVLSGKVDPIWSEAALKTQRVLDACLQSSREGGQLVTLDRA